MTTELKIAPVAMATALALAVAVALTPLSSASGTKIGRVSRQTGLTAATIEVDGPLDVVTAYDLRWMVAKVVRDGEPHIVLDLTRVSSVDDAGIAALAWCSEHAIASERVLTWTGCSQPLLAALRSPRSTQE